MIVLQMTNTISELFNILLIGTILQYLLNVIFHGFTKKSMRELNL